MRTKQILQFQTSDIGACVLFQVPFEHNAIEVALVVVCVPLLLLLVCILFFVCITRVVASIYRQTVVVHVNFSYDYGR